MTNYNERLDEVLFKVRTTRNVEHNDGQWSTEFVYSLDEAKQAITSLIKELVADAKPGNVYKTSDGQVPETFEAPAHAYDLAIQDFEQNILKALECN